MNSLKIIVCGGRRYSDANFAHRYLDGLDERQGPLTIITGSKKGADGLACDWAAWRLRPLLVIEADWDSYGKQAGPIRNRLMVTSQRPDAVIAFPGGKGTSNMIKTALELGVPVWRAIPSEVSPTPEAKQTAGSEVIPSGFGPTPSSPSIRDDQKDGPSDRDPWGLPE